MGQILRPDLIKPMVKDSSTQIRLPAGSWLTIGGQQYNPTSDLTLTLGTLVASTLYMVYAVVSGGVVSLTYSTNMNSVGPAGYLAWKLVGSFYASTVPDFGSFCNIDGIPSSDPQAFTS